MTLALALLLGQWMYPAPWGPACFDPWAVTLPMLDGDRMHLIVKEMAVREWPAAEQGMVCVFHADFNARHADTEEAIVQVRPMAICCPESWGREDCESAAHSRDMGPTCFAETP